MVMMNIKKRLTQILFPKVKQRTDGTAILVINYPY